MIGEVNITNLLHLPAAALELFPMPQTQEPKLISGNANMPLATAIARRMSMHRGKQVKLVDARVERFNDGEIFVEVYENVRGEDMFILQSTSNPANDNLMELLIMADALRRSSAARITALRYFAGKSSGRWISMAMRSTKWDFSFLSKRRVIRMLSAYSLKNGEPTRFRESARRAIYTAVAPSTIRTMSLQA